MSLAVVRSRAQAGVDAPEVRVEVHISGGLPAFNIVGLPEAAVREARDRVRSAIINSRYDFPARRITVNLAPADLPKEGGRFDLPIALGVLAASGQLPVAALEAREFLGELSLGGGLRPIRGALPAALKVRDAEREFVLPQDNADEAALVTDAHVRPAARLGGVVRHLDDEEPLPLHRTSPDAKRVEPVPDMAEVRGQHQARRALEIAAAGGHSLLFVGPPGTGKSMLASRLPGILPPMTDREAIEAAAVASVSDGGLDTSQWGIRPYRAPHHTASAVALVGGGSNPRPGEISLAHHGVMFLDEAPEFDRKVLEVLREPLESGHITISRAARQARYPARFQLVVAMNPCPCGYLGDPAGNCNCTEEKVRRYRGKLSGPLMDRIDLHVEVPRLPREALDPDASPPGEASASVRERVVACRERQLVRTERPNARLSQADIEAHCRPDREARAVLEQAMDRLALSARSYHRILKVARTIADLSGEETIRAPHVAEAVGLRVLDRKSAAAA